ncbi:hypothetical protein HN588_00520, partial [Candidatus Bathyarchaeota archaeon]|nr:hypothetical protein [Candidatus Bathyarchaeota archaeon]
TPLGNRTYNEFLIPGTSDLYGATATTSLNPVPQEAFDAEQRVNRDLNLLAEGQVGRVDDTVGTPFDLQGIQARQDQVDTSGFSQFFGTGQNMEDAIYDKQKARLDPRFQQQRGDLTQSLANRGIFAGSEAYDREFGNFNRSENDAYGQARNDSIMQGLQFGNAQRGQQFNEAGAQAQLANSGRQQDIQERAFLRNIPLNDVAALMGTGQVNVPQFGAVPQTGINAPDYQGAVANNYAGQVNAYNAQQQANASSSAGTMGMLGSLAMAGATAYAGRGSDRRLKKAIKKVGEFIDGINVYEYSYFWENVMRIGFMSDEVKEVIPEAVHVDSLGYDVVDYSMVIHGN